MCQEEDIDYSGLRRKKDTDILRLRLQLEWARAEERKVQAENERLQAEREMMRERVELGFQSLPQIKFQKWLKKRVMCCHFLMVLKRSVPCMVFTVNSSPEFCEVY